MRKNSFTLRFFLSYVQINRPGIKNAFSARNQTLLQYSGLFFSKFLKTEWSRQKTIAFKVRFYPVCKMWIYAGRTIKRPSSAKRSMIRKTILAKSLFTTNEETNERTIVRATKRARERTFTLSKESTPVQSNTRPSGRTQGRKSTKRSHGRPNDRWNGSAIERTSERANTQTNEPTYKRTIECQLFSDKFIAS